MQYIHMMDALEINSHPEIIALTRTVKYWWKSPSPALCFILYIRDCISTVYAIQSISIFFYVFVNMHQFSWCTTWHYMSHRKSHFISNPHSSCYSFYIIAIIVTAMVIPNISKYMLHGHPNIPKKESSGIQFSIDTIRKGWGKRLASWVTCGKY